MNRDDIIRMARKAGLRRYQANLMSNPPQIRFFYESDEESIKRFAALVAAAENEACAKVCENMCGPIEIYNPAYVHYVGCAEAIRERGQHD